MAETSARYRCQTRAVRYFEGKAGISTIWEGGGARPGFLRLTLPELSPDRRHGHPKKHGNNASATSCRRWILSLRARRSW